MVNVDGQIQSVTRAVHTATIDEERMRVQTLDQEYPSAIDDVWDAVTSAHRIGRWFLPVSGELRVGGHYQLEGNAGGEVLECHAPAAGTAEYRVSWTFGGGPDTWVTVRLTETASDRTRLELEHSARLDDFPDDELWTQYGPGATGVGWDSALLGLALHLTDPGARPDDPAAWSTSEEGMLFMRRSADAWAAADIASGTGADAAQRAADATFAAYTGQAPSEPEPTG